MEKLVYVLWKRGDEADSRFAERLRRETAPRLLALGAGRLRLCAVDDAVADGGRLRIGSMEPAKSGLATFWLEQSQDRGPLEDALARACGSLAGYLVVESRPLVKPTGLSAPGERTPGFSLVTCIVAKPGLSREEFLRQWYERQRDVAIETQSTFQYVRNEIVRPLTPDAPAWDAVVEEGFPAAALTDPAAFYDAEGSPEKLAANQRRMFETVRDFLALDRIESHPMSEYDFGPEA